MSKSSNIELRNIEVHVKLSEETPAYTARLFVEGNHFADLSNQGHGGCDMICPASGPSNGADFRGRLEALQEVFNNEEDLSLECVCHAKVWEHVDQRNFRSKLSRSILMVDGGKLYGLKGKKSAERIAAIKAKYPKAVVLNDLPFGEAWEIAAAA